jgi:hypothetical protein
MRCSIMSVRAVLIFVNSAMFRTVSRPAGAGALFYPHLPAAITEMDGSAIGDGQAEGGPPV